jgi:dTDP-L-rhamnose 4-epimerase
VRDIARAFRLALQRPQAKGHVVNIGSGRAYAISKVARLLAEAMGTPDRSPELLGKARSGDIRNCFADIAKARELIGFEPQYRLEDSLDEFVAWVRNTVAIDRSADMRRELEERGLVS